MQLISFASGGVWTPALEDGGRAVPASALTTLGHRPTARDLVALPEERRRAARQEATAMIAAGAPAVIQTGELRLGPPIPDPEKIICLGQNYPAHVSEMARETPEQPNLFPKFRNCLVGSGEAIRLPAASRQVDYEGELAVVVGRTCRGVDRASALSYVAGYSVVNDVSARDIQFATTQFLAGKAADTFLPMGPGLVFAEDVGDPQQLRLRTRLNGELVQDDTTASMIYSVAQAIAFISSIITLVPGDVIATGTPAGVGYKRNPPRFLAPGDVVAVEVEKVGTLTNPVV